jgi:hypothetical protein
VRFCMLGDAVGWVWQRHFGVGVAGEVEAGREGFASSGVCVARFCSCPSAQPAVLVYTAGAAALPLVHHNWMFCQQSVCVLRFV